MNLQSFRIRNFRSINDSGDIDVSKITALLGRNESGKSNLLLALRSLNPSDGFDELNPIKDFPRHRRLEECTKHTKVVSTLWSLTDDEQCELSDILPRAKGVNEVEIGRYYEKRRWASFVNLSDQEFDENTTKGKILKVAPAVKAAATKLEDTLKMQLDQAADQFEKDITLMADRTAWAKKAISAIMNLRQSLATVNAELTDTQDKHIIWLEELAKLIAGDEEAQKKARIWAITKLPIFIFLDEYPELNGHQNIAEYLQRKSNPVTLTPSDYNFEKLCKVAGLQPEELNELLSQKEQETRNQLANRASAVVTSEIRRLWKDRTLKIRFNLDAEHFDTLVSDPNAIYDVEVNLDERSRGFKWFISFYVTFSADTQGGHAEEAILLLDEPGLYLHAKSQSDLLTHLEKDFKNQIIYTTHSPFMVPTHNLDSVRTVKIIEINGTSVTNNPTGDARTLFPIQAALGYELAQSLFIGPNNLIVEGVTDYWVLSSIAEYLADAGRITLSNKLTITPAGGAQKVSYMVALLTSEKLNVLVLLDNEKDAKNTKDYLVKSKLIREKNVVFVTEAFLANPPEEADIEDLLDSDVYVALIKESYAQELNGKTLSLNAKIPRIAKRVEAAFNSLGIEFHKTRPTRLLLNKMAIAPESIVSEDTAKRFETIFAVINDRLENHTARDDKPFQ
ncbi:MAG: AAA family ATPase [Candidatus Thiodiazotropha endolucinida]